MSKTTNTERVASRPPKAGSTFEAQLSSSPGPRRWLLFVHQLPPNGSNLRVRTWRRLQQLGAVPVRQAVYALPDTPASREDFEWLKTEVQSAGGAVTVFAADNLDAWSDDALVESFRESSQQVYAALAREAEQLLKRMKVRRRGRSERAPASGRLLESFRERLAAAERADHFGGVGRDRVLSALRRLESERAAATGRAPARLPAHAEAAAFQGRLWVTRPRPGVDRIASAWLIRRFIDPKARFGFVSDRSAVAAQAVPFDMFGVEFSHQGEGCTFETLCGVFGLRQPAVEWISTIVHDLDLKDGRFGAQEVATVGALIDGLQLAYVDDQMLLDQGIILFESLYRSFKPTGKWRAAGKRRGNHKSAED